MLHWLFPNPARTEAKELVEMCALAMRLGELTGSRRGFFEQHPFLVSKQIPMHPDDAHIYYLKHGGRTYCALAVDGEKGWVSISPGEAFEGFTVQCVRAGRFIVRVERSRPRPTGRHARKLLEVFVREYDAADVSI